MSEQAFKLGAVFYPDFELLDSYGPLEMFGGMGEAVEILTVAHQPGPVRSAQGPQTLAEYGFDDCPALDGLLIPGGVGTLAMLTDEALLAFLRKRAANARVTMSVCSGSALLAKAGLLDGLRATSNKQFFDLARSQGDSVHWIEEARWVEDGSFATSSGVSAGMDMALAVIERLFSKKDAERIAILTEYERSTDPSHDPFVRYLNEGAATLGGKLTLEAGSSS